MRKCKIQKMWKFKIQKMWKCKENKRGIWESKKLSLFLMQISLLNILYFFLIHCARIYLCEKEEKSGHIKNNDIFFGFSNAAFIFFTFSHLFDFTFSHLLDFWTFVSFIFPFWVSFLVVFQCKWVHLEILVNLKINIVLKKRSLSALIEITSSRQCFQINNWIFAA